MLRERTNTPYLKVFISSTFQDMSKERDVIMGKVRPLIKKYAEKEGIRIEFIDTRWGITSEEAKNGKVVERCLRLIDDCRPLFLGIIGDRYGWCPKISDFTNNQTLRKLYPEIEKYYRSKKSITEMEMLYGSLNSQQPTHSAFFILRDLDEKHGRIEGIKNGPKLRKLYEKIKKGKSHETYLYSRDNLEWFEEKVYRWIKKVIDEQFPTPFVSEEIELPELSEDDLHELFLQKLAEAGKTLMPEQQKAVFSGANAQTEEGLSAFLDDLLSFGIFEDLDKFIAWRSNISIHDYQVMHLQRAIAVAGPHLAQILAYIYFTNEGISRNTLNDYFHDYEDSSLLIDNFESLQVIQEVRRDNDKYLKIKDEYRRDVYNCVVGDKEHELCLRTQYLERLLSDYCETRMSETRSMATEYTLLFLKATDEMTSHSAEEGDPYLDKEERDSINGIPADEWESIVLDQVRHTSLLDSYDFDNKRIFDTLRNNFLEQLKGWSHFDDCHVYYEDFSYIHTMMEEDVYFDARTLGEKTMHLLIFLFYDENEGELLTKWERNEMFHACGEADRFFNETGNEFLWETYGGMMNEIGEQYDHDPPAKLLDYLGETRDDNPEGLGLGMIDGGAVYNGEWHKGYRHGHGVMEYPDGNVFEGEFSYDEFSGKDMLRCLSDEGMPQFGLAFGDIMVADFRGENTYDEIVYHADGSVFARNIVEGQSGDFHLLCDGRIFIGDILENKFNSRGVVYFPGGAVLLGTWKEGRPVGRFTIYLPDGTKYTKLFSKHYKYKAECNMIALMEKTSNRESLYEMLDKVVTKINERGIPERPLTVNGIIEY